MTLLTICQDAANIIGITSPSAVTASTDLSVIQLEAAVNQEGRVDAALAQHLQERPRPREAHVLVSLPEDAALRLGRRR